MEPIKNEPHVCPAELPTSSEPEEKCSTNEPYINSAFTEDCYEVNTTTPTKVNDDNSSVEQREIYWTRKQAYDNGKQVAKDLIGYTTEAEQYRVSDILNNKVNQNNVVTFLHGYEDNRSQTGLRIASSGFAGKGDHFFEQLCSEDGYYEQQELMRSTAEKLGEYFRMCGADDEAAKIKGILANDWLTKADAKALDKLAQDAIKYSK